MKTSRNRRMNHASKLKKLNGPNEGNAMQRRFVRESRERRLKAAPDAGPLFRLSD
jgi:hypothetical protein